jgi:hypothetical protein
MEDDPEGVPTPGADAAYSVLQIDTVAAAGALNRPVANGKDDAIASPERHDLRPRLHSRTLLREDEFAAGKIHLGFL